jgi:FtsH-binding integral membrane protein
MKSEEDTVTNMNSTIRQPSAFLPVAMSLVALALVLGHVALFGVVLEADEGTAAHIWQILMAAQVPIMAFFAIKYLPQKPKQALLILTLQIVAALTACAPVFFFKL